MPNGEISIVVIGDLVLDEPDADHWLAGIAPALRQADLAIGHVEVPHSDCEYEMPGDIPAPGAPPENLQAIADAGIAMVSLAGNHVADCGAQGIAETVSGLDRAGVLHCGAGSNINLARKPAVTVVEGKRIAFLSYNCVGPEATWATATKAGCAYLPIRANDGSPISPRANLSEIDTEAYDILRSDIAAAHDLADFVLVAMHKGIVHTPAKLAPYERDLARAAIDAGCDAVIGHHAHIARGIEFHRGKPIFHGLGNGCVVTQALTLDQDHPARREWAKRRRETFGFEPDPAYTLAPFHPEARNAFIGHLVFNENGNLRVGVIPVDVEPPGRPVIAEGGRAAEIAKYLEQITSRAGMPPIDIDEHGFVSEAA
ncbi:CapA family protein [Altererythrobacter sp.]|uniref:CapA family protein n=1 Tax=Altererythrobacter sp. TaxID=1872480 RepID=UPI003D06310B